MLSFRNQDDNASFNTSSQPEMDTITLSTPLCTTLVSNKILVGCLLHLLVAKSCPHNLISIKGEVIVSCHISVSKFETVESLEVNCNNLI